MRLAARVGAIAADGILNGSYNRKAAVHQGPFKKPRAAARSRFPAARNGEAFSAADGGPNESLAAALAGQTNSLPPDSGVAATVSGATIYITSNLNVNITLHDLSVLQRLLKVWRQVNQTFLLFSGRRSCRLSKR